jgi:hypothetical protein
VYHFISNIFSNQLLYNFKVKENLLTAELSARQQIIGPPVPKKHTIKTMKDQPIFFGQGMIGGD